MKGERLRFSTSILRLLGEELNPSPDQGILELIKNAYDADATLCEVELRGVHIPGGSITVEDNGRGMTVEEIINGWLVVGDSLKSKSRRSVGGRLLVGDKGLGRLGALRLGKKAVLITRPDSTPLKQYRVELDWNSFESADIVEDVELDIMEEERTPNFKQGTSIEIKDLPFAWKETGIKRLARSILLLTDPFDQQSDFKALLKSDQFKDITDKASKEYFTYCDFYLNAKLDENGFASAEVRNSLNDLLYKADHKKIIDTSSNPLYSCPSLTFELWEFLLDGKRFSTKTVRLRDIKGWLSEFGGVRVYYRGMRVLPYGDPQNDWLDMNLRRVRNPELRPSTNNSLGRIVINDPSALLHQKTDRLGFVENETFEELRKFAGDVLDWMANERLRSRDKKRKSEKEKVNKQKKEAEKNLDKTISELPTQFKNKIENAIKGIQKAHDAEITLLNDTAQLYYTLGTVGTTAAAFAHQTKHPLQVIVEDANLLENWLGDPMSFNLDFYREKSSSAVNRIKLEADALYSFSEITLKLLEHEKRRARPYDIHKLIVLSKELLNPYIESRQVTIDYEFVAQNLMVICSQAAMESIFINLLTNSLQAFTFDSEELPNETIESIKHNQRIVKFKTQIVGDKGIISVSDNGPGINNISLDDIWLPGKTTTISGSGLGLTIVRDIVSDLGGTVDAVEHGDLGGATFTIILPIRGKK